MKLVFFLFVALLAFHSLAAVPHHARRGLELPPGAYWMNGTLQLPYYNDTHAKDSGKSNISSSVDSVLSNQGSNASVAGTGQTSWPKDQLAIDIRVGGSKSHVGTLRKHRLSNAIHNCLNDMGKQLDPVAPEICKFYNFYYCRFSCKIPNIVYEAGKGNYATNAYLSITMDWSELYDSKHPGTRDFAFRLISDIYASATEVPENCYTVDFKNSRRTTVCNVPEQLLIVWPARGNSEMQGRMNLKLDFNGKTEFGKVDCEAGRAGITKLFKNKYHSDLAKMTNFPKDKVRLFNSCQKNSCFGVEGYTPGKIWSEPKGCDAPIDYENLD